ncbi:MAG: hypothetical protein Q4A31_09295 [Corynebacterium sp.]|nr:hypothetical protein [Corynebacterium sp.]MDO4762099.1 hypothetical protein [Corynebacterium sp.]
MTVVLVALICQIPSSDWCMCVVTCTNVSFDGKNRDVNIAYCIKNQVVIV